MTQLIQWHTIIATAIAYAAEINLWKIFSMRWTTGISATFQKR